MKLRNLTAEEWFAVRTARGAAMTGQRSHRTKMIPIQASDPTYVRGAGKTYYWCMGAQPDDETIKTIARRCPIKAAEAYLAVYHPNDPASWPQGFVQPVLKDHHAVS